MLIALLAFLGGMLTIVSPCILPVLPFVFARGDRPFLRSGLPLLGGMAVSFAAVASLAAVGGGWAVQANAAGRWVALVLLGLFGLALVLPSLSERMTRPLVRLGARLNERASDPGRGGEIGASALLGVATGLLWAPCAGPILGIIFTTAALNGASANTALLLFAYALGAATSLALALLAGGRIFKRMKGSLGSADWVRKGLGVAVIGGVLAIALGLDTTVLAKLSSSQTTSLESAIARKLGVGGIAEDSKLRTDRDGRLILDVEGRLPSLAGLGPWINSPPLTREQLRGKVVLIDFWTYSCINCLRAIPYVRAWHERYARDGLVIIGVHAPEFAFERDPANVRRAVADLGIPYPVALDNRYDLWRAMNNRFWPAHYFIDAEGRVRYHHFGEGKYDQSERVIRQLLAEAGRRPAPRGPAELKLEGAEVGAAFQFVRSPETYLGHRRAERFVSPGGMVKDQASNYRPAPLALNDWALDGNWLIGPQSARSQSAGGKISYRFHARDLHLVLAAPDGPVRFRLLVDGAPPGADAGVDVDSGGRGMVRDERLYQLIRHKGAVRERSFTIEFDGPVEAFAFTFG